LTGEQQAVFVNCFERQTLLENYDQPIPLAALREIEALNKLKEDESSVYSVFRIMVLHPLLAGDPDPVLIARIGTGESEWSASWHLVSRWGSSLLPFAELRAIARSKVVAAIESAKEELAHAAKVAKVCPPHRWPSRIKGWSNTHEVVDNEAIDVIAKS